MAKKTDHNKDTGKEPAKIVEGAGKASGQSKALARAMEMLGPALLPSARLEEAKAELQVRQKEELRALLKTLGYPTSLEFPRPERSAFLPKAEQPIPTPITSAADIGALVRAERKRMGLNQQAFADLAGVGRRFVSELEGGKPTLEFDRVLQVCAAAGIDLSASPRALPK